MYKHIAEAFVAVTHAQCVAEKICTRAGDCCRSIVTEDPDRLLHFEDGRAIVRLANDGLFLRVSARDPVVFYGIRTLLEGSLMRYLSHRERVVEWLPAEAAPFHAIRRQMFDDRSMTTRCP